MFKQLCRLQRYTFLHDLPNVYNTFYTNFPHEHTLFYTNFSRIHTLFYTNFVLYVKKLSPFSFIHHY